jgi:hypothetical protein
MRAQDAAKRVSDWIFHRKAVREARAALPRGDDRREAATRQAKLLLEVARRVAEPSDVLPPGAQPAVALGMYRDAIYWALAARGTGGDQPPADLRALWDASNPQVVAVAAAAPDNADSAALRRTLFDDYDPRSLAVTDDDVARARAFAEALIWNLDAPRRRLSWVLTQRWLRIAAVAGAVLLLVGGVRSLVQGTNLAAGKPFRLSAPWAGWTDCVAGGGCPGLMFHTDTADNPWVEIDLGDGTTHAFVVVETHLIAKTELPAELFERDGPPKLVLITCGGEFDRSIHRYRQNVVVVAAPA